VWAGVFGHWKFWNFLEEIKSPLGHEFYASINSGKNPKTEKSSTKFSTSYIHSLTNPPKKLSNQQSPSRKKKFYFPTNCSKKFWIFWGKRILIKKLAISPTKKKTLLKFE
jgi:hypothetical protein